MIQTPSTIAPVTMSPYEQWDLVIQGLGFVGIVLSLWVGRRSALADHDRQKKQATIEVIDGVRPKLRDHYRALQAKFGHEVLSDADAKAIAGNDEARLQARELLALLEHLCLGVNRGVYDKEILFDACGAYLLYIYKMMQSYIELNQIENPKLYTEFQHVAHDFSERKRVRPSGAHTVLKP